MTSDQYPGSPTRNPEPGTRNSPDWGLDPSLFGRHPAGAKVDATSLCVRAPSVIEVRLPADFVEGCEFVATATLHRETGAEGSVQMQVLATKPASVGLTAGAAKEQGVQVRAHSPSVPMSAQKVSAKPG